MAHAAVEVKQNGTPPGSPAADSAGWNEAEAAGMNTDEAFAAILNGTRATLQQSLALIQRSAQTLQQCDDVLERSAQLHFLASNSRQICQRLTEEERGEAGQRSKPANQQSSK